MKRLIPVFILLSIIAGFCACEKDDICGGDIQTTPRLVVQFYYTDTDSILNVFNLKVIGEGMIEPIVFKETATDSSRYLFGGNKLTLPLRLTEDITTYYLTQNAESASAQTDTLQFNYARQSVYISRACGFKTLFNLNDSADLPNPFILNNDPTATAGNWIQNITVEKYNIETENETHLNIYFSN